MGSQTGGWVCIKRNSTAIKGLYINGKLRHWKQDAVGGSRLRPRCRYTANWTKHTRRLWFWPIRSIMLKHGVIRKTRNT